MPVELCTKNITLDRTEARYLCLSVYRRFQRGHGLGSILGGFVRRLVLPFIKSNAKCIEKNFAKTGVEVANDVIDGRSFTDSVKDRVPPTIKRGVQTIVSQSAPAKRPRTPVAKTSSTSLRYLCMMAFVHEQSCECTKSKSYPLSVPPTQTSMEQGSWIEYYPITSVIEGSPVEFDINGSGEREREFIYHQ